MTTTITLEQAQAALDATAWVMADDSGDPAPVVTLRQYITQQAERLRVAEQHVQDLRATIPQGADVCCCGDNMIGHSDPMSCGHTPKSMIDWEMEKLVIDNEKKDEAITLGIVYVAAALSNCKFTKERMQNDIAVLEAALKAQGV